MLRAVHLLPLWLRRWLVCASAAVVATSMLLLPALPVSTSAVTTAATLRAGLAAQFIYSLGLQEPRHICSRVGLPALTARASLVCLVFQLTKARVRLVL
jgi:hypothetical protein